jgi:hypothetical protein
MKIRCVQWDCAAGIECIMHSVYIWGSSAIQSQAGKSFWAWHGLAEQGAYLVSIFVGDNGGLGRKCSYMGNSRQRGGEG